MVGHNAHLITEYFLCSCKKSSWQPKLDSQ
jgi:hypothetical protein